MPAARSESTIRDSTRVACCAETDHVATPKRETRRKVIMELVTTDGRRFPLKMGTNVVGRSMDSTIPLDDASMSRQHAELRWNGQECVVVDLGSTNGTFLENHRLPPGQPVAVQPGMALRFGPDLTATIEPGQPFAPTAYASPAFGRPGSEQAGRGAGFDLFFRAFDVALDLRKLGVAFAGLLLSMIVAAFFVWVMSQAAEVSEALAIATGLVGGIAVWILFTLTAGTLSRLVLVELAEGRREDVRAAL
ncbi:MAG: FHA domain-containing protein, partial [Anaerolineae bacterium]|nr:FHA domain-containing protein [Anaerolineae bacterium]